jgi:putative DNA primase/helicase
MVRSGPPQGGLSGINAPAWWYNLILTDKGTARAISRNGMIALSQDPAFAGAIRFDKFRLQTMACAPLPWDLNITSPRPWTDYDDVKASWWLQEQGIMLSEKHARVIVDGIAKDPHNSYHPVIDYLNSIAWNGITPHVPWLTYYCGVEDTPYSRAVGQAWAVSAIARVDQPGCKADCVLVLEGAQGIGKSTTFKTLGGVWYSNTISILGSDDSREQIMGVWIVEI